MTWSVATLPFCMNSFWILEQYFQQSWMIHRKKLAREGLNDTWGKRSQLSFVVSSFIDVPHGQEAKLACYSNYFRGHATTERSEMLGSHWFMFPICSLWYRAWNRWQACAGVLRWRRRTVYCPRSRTGFAYVKSRRYSCFRNICEVFYTTRVLYAAIKSEVFTSVVLYRRLLRRSDKQLAESRRLSAANKLLPLSQRKFRNH